MAAIGSQCTRLTAALATRMLTGANAPARSVRDKTAHHRGEAYQFEWSHEVVLLSGVTVIVKAAHVRLCHSRTLFVRAYPRETLPGVCPVQGCMPSPIVL